MHSPTEISLHGIAVYLDRRLGRFTKQVRFPRSKRKRVQKKWRRNRSNWRVFYGGPQLIHVEPTRDPILGRMTPGMLIVNTPGLRELGKILLPSQFGRNGRSRGGAVRVTS